MAQHIGQKNYVTIAGYQFGNSLWDDGSVWIARNRRLVWSIYLPLWFVTAYNRVCAKLTDGKGN